MPRPERELDPTAGPVQQFAYELRTLRTKAGDPKYLQMARQTGKSRTALSEAAGGDHLATWETVAAYVRACGEDPLKWRTRWEAVQEHQLARRAASSASGGETQALGQSGTADGADGSKSDGRPRGDRRRWKWVTAVLIVLVGGAVATALAWSTDESPQQPGGTSGPIVIVVQNKVALGGSSLTEDTTPAYISAKTQPRCGSRGCKLPGTDFWSGAVLPAVCVAEGATMYNYDLTDPAALLNAEHVSSPLWYRVRMPDERSGWLSEVYIAAKYRGGQGLPRCQGLDAEGAVVQ